MKRSENLIIVEGHDDVHVLIRCVEKFGYELNKERHPEEQFASRRAHEENWTRIEYVAGNQRASQSESVGNKSAKLSGKDAALNRLRNEIKAQGRQGIAIIVDADDNLMGTWDSIRNIAGLGKEVKLPNEGFVGWTRDSSVVLGCWVMPDNFGDGKLENFLLRMVEADKERGIQYAKEVVSNLPDSVRRFEKKDTVKSELHTWLAWQEDPGPRPAVAIARKILSLETTEAKRFLAWLAKWLQEIEKGVQE